MIASLFDVYVGRAVNGHSIWIFELPVASPLPCYYAEESTARRTFLNPSVPRIGDQNVSVAVDSNSRGGIKLSLAISLSAFRHVSYPFGQGTELGKLGPRRLNRSLRECAHALLKLLNVL